MKAVPKQMKPDGDVRKIRVLIVDDHPLLRLGMRALIEQRSRYEVCGEADNSPEAIELAARLKPDVAIVDIQLKSTDGIELTKSIQAQSPETHILIVSVHDEEVYAERALRAGAKGYVMKQQATEQLLNAIDQITAGDVYISPRLKDRMLNRLFTHSPDKVASPPELLSDREFEVFRLIGNGYGTRAIAERLHLSVKTIDSYREHLKQKLNLGTSSDLVRYAIQWGKSQPAA